MTALTLVGGLVVLLVGAEVLLRGTETLARSWQIHPVIIAVTVVAFGSSAPELVVSLIAAARQSPGLAVGNVLGSNLANIALVLGLVAVVRVVPVERRLLRFELPALLVLQAGVLWILWDAQVEVWEGLILTVTGLGYVYVNVRRARMGRRSVSMEVTVEEPSGSRFAAAMSLLFGLTCLPVGAKLVESAAETMALALGFSERVIGLTVVAVGTSLPEVVTSLLAALRGNMAVAAGTVLGSNVFNICYVLGITGTVFPFAMQGERGPLTFDLWATLGLTAALAALCWSLKRVPRLAGVVFLLIYVAILTLSVLGGREVA